MPEQTVAVKLGAEIVYVSGTVNGAETQWQLYQGTVWRATVPRSEMGSYNIRLTGWDELGRSTPYATTLQYGFAAVTGRGPGSYYNATDLNWVGRAVEYLTDLLAGYGYAVETAPRTDWEMEDFPTRVEMETYLGNIRALMDVFCVLPATPQPPESMERLGYRGANAIEQILVDMYLLIQNMAAAWFHCGEVYSGEV